MTLGFWIVLACGPEDADEFGPGAPLAPAFDHLEAVPALGAAPSAAPMRAVNALGAAAPTDPLDLLIDGAPSTFVDDGTGYGAVDLVAPGSADVLFDGVVVTRVHAAASAWSPGAWPSVPAPGLGLAATPGTRGAFVATADAVWWTSGDAAVLPAHPVLRPGVPIAGLRAGNIDNDGVLDVVAWGDDQVWWLRGRIGGGASWGGGWQVAGATATGVDLGDVDMDGANDIAIAWADAPDGDLLDVRLGDDTGGFRAATTVVLADRPRAIGVGANGSQGEVQVTVLDDSDGWARYVWTSDALMATGPRLVGLFFEPGTAIEAGWDTNGDGANELIFIGPRAGDDIDVALKLYDLVQDDGGITYTPFDALGARVALADYDANQTAEMLLVLGDGSLVNSRWNGSSYQQSTANRLGDLGAIALADIDADRTLDLTVAGMQTWAMWRGSVTVADGLATWATTGPAATPAVEGLGDVGTVGLRFGKPTLVAFAAAGTRLQRITGGAGVAYDVATLYDGLTGSAGLDVAVCDGVAYALTDAALARVALESGAATAIPWSGGKAVACDGDAVWVLGGGELATRDGATLAARGAPVASAGRDVAASDAGPVTCDTDGCQVVRWTFGDDGTGLTIHRDFARATGARGHDAVDLPAGPLSVGDVDGDGLDDLLVVNAHTVGAQVTVVRSTGEGFGPPIAAHATGAGLGPAVLLDAGDDGTPDLHVFANGTLYRWPR